MGPLWQWRCAEWAVPRARPDVHRDKPAQKGTGCENLPGLPTQHEAVMATLTEHGPSTHDDVHHGSAAPGSAAAATTPGRLTPPPSAITNDDASPSPTSSVRM